MLRWLAAHLSSSRCALAGGAYFAAGRATPPTITIDTARQARRPDGHAAVHRSARRGALFSRSAIVARAERQDHSAVRRSPRRKAPRSNAARRGSHADHAADRQGRACPSCRQGTAADHRHGDSTVVSPIRERLSTTASKDIQVRLEPPRIAVLSTKHYLNHGGSELVVYRATPADVDSGVRVGDVEYRGFPASAPACRRPIRR